MSVDDEVEIDASEDSSDIEITVNEAGTDDEATNDVDVTIVESPANDALPVDVAIDLGSRLARLEDAIAMLTAATVDTAARTDAVADITTELAGELGTIEAGIEAAATAEIELEQEMEEVVADDPPATRKRNFHRTWFGQ